MKSELQILEDSILEMEAQFSQNQPVDVSLLLKKTRRLTQLQVDLAKEEGLRAGLVIQDLKKQRTLKEEKAVLPDKLESATAFVGIKPVKTGETLVSNAIFTENPPPYVETESSIGLDRVFPQGGAEERKDIRAAFMEKYSELNLGKYVMAILAAILAMAGTLLLGALMWENISNEMKAGFFTVIASLMIFLPFRHVMAKEIRQSNGFLTSLMGAGLSIHYINCIFMGTTWAMLSDTVLLLSLVGLIFLTVFLSHHIQSNTLLTVSFIGNFLTYFLLVLKEIPINQLFIAVIFLLATTLFLLAYTLKNVWTYGLTKLCSLILGLLVLGRANDAIKMGNSNYFRDQISLDNLYVPHFQVDSPYFPLYLVILLFGIILGLVIGSASSQPPSVGDSDMKKGGDLTVFYCIGLGVSYFTFASVFGEAVWPLFLAIMSTFMINSEKSSATLMSTPFMLFILAEGSGVVSELLGLGNSSNMQEVVYFFSLILVALSLYVLTRFSQSRRYKISILLYTFMAFLLYMLELKYFWETVPMLVLLLCLFLQGYQDLEEEGSFSLIQLSMFIPISFIIAKSLWYFVDRSDDFSNYLAVVLLFSSCALTFSTRYLEKLEYEDKFQKLVFAIKMLSFFMVCSDLSLGRQEISLLMLQTLVIILVLVELFYRISLPQSEQKFKAAKQIYLILSLVGINSWTQSTPLGDFSVSASILILLVGCVSIYLGFRQEEVEMRHFGLGMAILSVLKMVTVDISSTDSIIRVVALIFGAVVCFLISCFYNKIDPSPKKNNFDQEKSPPDG